MSGRTYSFLNFNCAISGPGGVISIGNGSGANDEGISFEPAEDISTMEVGPDGTGQHSLHGNKSGHITLHLLKTSPANATLMAMYNYQTGSPANHGQNNISGVDTISGDVVTCQQVAFKRRPTMKQGKVAGYNDWQFDAVQMDIVLGLIT
jgi:structural protein KPP10_ORF10